MGASEFQSSLAIRAAENARGKNAKWFWICLDPEEEGHEHNPWTLIGRTITWLCLIGCHRPQVMSVTPPAEKAFCHLDFVIARRRERMQRALTPMLCCWRILSAGKVTAEAHQVTWTQDTPYSLGARYQSRLISQCIIEYHKHVHDTNSFFC